MDRRNFLRLLGGALAAAAAPTKAYSFIGGILRPKPIWVPSDIRWIEVKWDYGLLVEVNLERLILGFKFDEGPRIPFPPMLEPQRGPQVTP